MFMVKLTVYEQVESLRQERVLAINFVQQSILSIWAILDTFYFNITQCQNIVKYKTGTTPRPLCAGHIPADHGWVPLQHPRMGGGVILLQLLLFRHAMPHKGGIAPSYQTHWFQPEKNNNR